MPSSPRPRSRTVVRDGLLWASRRHHAAGRRVRRRRRCKADQPPSPGTITQHAALDPRRAGPGGEENQRTTDPASSSESTSPSSSPFGGTIEGRRLGAGRPSNSAYRGWRGTRAGPTSASPVARVADMKQRAAAQGELGDPAVHQLPPARGCAPDSSPPPRRARARAVASFVRMSLHAGSAASATSTPPGGASRSRPPRPSPRGRRGAYSPLVRRDDGSAGGAAGPRRGPAGFSADAATTISSEAPPAAGVPRMGSAVAALDPPSQPGLPDPVTLGHRSSSAFVELPAASISLVPRVTWSINSSTAREMLMQRTWAIRSQRSAGVGAGPTSPSLTSRPPHRPSEDSDRSPIEIRTSTYGGPWSAARAEKVDQLLDADRGRFAAGRA